MHWKLLWFIVRLIFIFLHVKQGVHQLRVWLWPGRSYPFPCRTGAVDRGWFLLLSACWFWGGHWEWGGLSHQRLFTLSEKTKWTQKRKETECVMKESERKRRGSILRCPGLWVLLYSGLGTMNIAHFHQRSLSSLENLSCLKPYVFALLSIWWQNEVRIKVCLWVRCTYCATGNIATRLLLRLFTVTVDYHPLEVKL